MLTDKQIDAVISKVVSGFSGLDSHLREDLKQELWLKVLENEVLRKAPEHFLYRALQCDAYNWYEHTFKCGPVIIYNSELAGQLAEAKESTPTEADIKREIEETIESRFVGLTEREKEVAQLLACDYTHEEIANKLGIQRQRVTAIVKQLQHKWRDD